MGWRGERTAQQVAVEAGGEGEVVLEDGHPRVFDVGAQPQPLPEDALVRRLHPDALLAVVPLEVVGEVHDVVGRGELAARHVDRDEQRDLELLVPARLADAVEVLEQCVQRQRPLARKHDQTDGRAELLEGELLLVLVGAWVPARGVGERRRRHRRRRQRRGGSEKGGGQHVEGPEAEAAFYGLGEGGGSCGGVHTPKDLARLVCGYTGDLSRLYRPRGHKNTSAASYDPCLGCLGG